ncbi:sigma-70 family RNA polymerase sigma factor [Gemmobacter denitrificans]|uniref:Sigma-70 family RNA polymerase sigma factor n=1 Tax=Gemmobacter denitrificans TaxID=3123040 RepID=A0ABU8BRJ9_9RHOB
MDDPIAALLQRCAVQDRAAFRELYAATSAKLMGVLLRMLRERHEAEEALQEVYTRIWLRADRFDPGKGRGMTWVIAVARNLAIDRLRMRPMETDTDVVEMVADTTPRAENRLIALGEARAIAECFGLLEPERASALRGAYLDGASYADLASRHAVPLNTMRTWLRRGLMALRACMEGRRA